MFPNVENQKSDQGDRYHYLGIDHLIKMHTLPQRRMLRAALRCCQVALLHDAVLR